MPEDMSARDKNWQFFPQTNNNNNDKQTKDPRLKPHALKKNTIIKKQKFGSFMGKILLQSNNKKSSSEKGGVEQQKALKEEPFSGLFQVRKNRIEQSNTCRSTNSNAVEIKFSFKKDLANFPPSVKNYRIVNGRKTRWDIQDSPSTQQQHADEKNEQEEDESSHSSDEDTNSINTLQSDDDVLGPWIELGMIDPITTTTTTTTLDTALKKNWPADVCQECLSHNQSRGPFESINLCAQCKVEWNFLFRDLENKMKGFSSLSLDNNNKKRVEKFSSKSTTTTTIKKSTIISKPNNNNNNQATHTNRQKAIIPPTKSNHFQKANKKIMASKKNQDLLLKKKPTSDHITTGAFLTRKTALTLADPENGFYPNPYGFLHHQHVEVLNMNGLWYLGRLEMMDKGKVKVKYLDWDDQEEWIIMGSRRLRIAEDQSIIARESQNKMSSSEDIIDIVNVDKKDNITSPLNNKKELLNNSTPVSVNKKKLDDDYISQTLDKDPMHIFNNNEVFMTRKMARELTDQFGFKPNLFGYRRNRPVMITSFSGSTKKKKEEHLGFLREMSQDQVRVWYPDLHLSEWLPIGTRRIRVMTEEEEEEEKEKASLINKVDLDIEETAPSSQTVITSLAEETRTKDDENTVVQKSDTSNETSDTPISVVKRGRGRPRKKSSTIDTGINHSIIKPTKSQRKNKTEVSTKKNLSVISSIETDTSKFPSTLSNNNSISSSFTTASTEQQDKNSSSSVHEFLTTGAFATRHTMRQLRDENGFIPNPYGYKYKLAVEVLNTRSGKAKFWEHGTLIEMRPGQVKVHYDGWADIYDEWIKVGSRRIRIASQEENSISDIANSNTADIGNTDLLIAEQNPELVEEVRKNRKHQIIRPEDYQKLGLLVSLDELAEKETKKRKKRQEKMKVQQQKRKISDYQHSDSNGSSGKEGSDSDHQYTPVSKQRTKKIRTTKKKKKHQTSAYSNHHSCKHHASTETEKIDTILTETDGAQQKIISLRLAQAKASGSSQFVANVYGYDYMQHVTVLHFDKKVYEGRLVSINKNKVRVHYCGWLDAFDEYITLGSRRIQPIENDHEVVCLEPGYKERYESNNSILTENIATTVDPCCCHKDQKPHTINRFSRKRLTLDDAKLNETSDNDSVEYHKDMINADDEEVIETENWKVYCNQCNIVIKQFRYYCTYCETPSLGYDYQSFELCLRCFDQNFPFWHEHPRSSFAIQAVIDAEIGPRPIKGELVTIWEEDILDETPLEALPDTNEPLIKDVNVINDSSSQGFVTANTIQETNSKHRTEEESIDASKVFTGDAPITTDQGYKYLKKWRRRKVCAFCNDDDDTSEELGSFIGPFIIATFNKNGIEKKRSFWAHDACARYSPEVFCTPEGKWYNVTLALRRGRGMRCHNCKEKGATIGCFESKCSRSFHLPCTQKPVSYFKNGVIFWCGIHEAYYNKIDTYVNIFNCDGCNKELADESWFTCVPCSQSYFSSFDLCMECFENFPKDHPHNEDEFEETSFAIIKEMEAQKATEIAREKEERRLANAKKRKRPLFPKRRRKLANGSLPVSCCYCGTYDADSWRKGYDGGVIMCNKCFELALLIDNDGEPLPEDMPLVIENDNNETQIMQQHRLQNRYVSSIEDYSHKPYLTRDTLSLTKFNESPTSMRLASYEPQPNQLFSLVFDSTYFDIPGRAPRWASHSGTDYHGTWLPQTVRRAILKYTAKDERILSNFLGRGTDAIECFLLQRKCCGVDINPSAITLSQRNCCFEVPPGLTSAEYRPIIAQADSRHLSGALFTDESYHHILSHPPYKDCVAYSTHLDGDLSRFTNIEEFKLEYIKVVKESWRLLKMSRRLTLGIGDNREHCFYIPVSFHLIRLYIDHGFELEELIIKRQRYCSAFGLGTYLCVQFDFLVFTHEFIATFKKIPMENINRMLIEDNLDNDTSEIIEVRRTLRGVPSSAIMRKSRVMGTVWIFKPTTNYSFSQLCVSRMVERFGKDDGNWEYIELKLKKQQMHSAILKTANTQTGDLIDNGVIKVLKKNGTAETEEKVTLSEYEQERLKRIQENNKTLLKLGLISELSEESEDVIHCDTMMNKAPYNGGDLVLMVTGHIEPILPGQINCYRKSIVSLANEAIDKLATKGMLIIGTQDIRDPITGKLWPLTMLVLEDIERALGCNVIKLKEMVVTVPDGYSKDRKTEYEPVQEQEEDFIDIETIEHDHLPIVHAIYLVFQKL
ncbi:uncharacterized protein BX663DRAFT_555836 [Cokeromyces recurvatus]|uniref:uncharacterized protein n=1 Tax=Cokeromyces recurvatus TaxID=90255 RepID=UPI0022210CCD|nr:uncharacterized protein BX663DRAFT_555836 [Cokeromyces recurvatus]KAI7898479.1 hypothetical protein BX663DRAFT_555836 [Cokeromyces recurvatus]